MVISPARTLSTILVFFSTGITGGLPMVKLSAQDSINRPATKSDARHSDPSSDLSRWGRSIALRGFWSTRRAPFGALRGQQRRTRLVHFRGGRTEQLERVDQAVTTLRNDEALVKVASHQGFLSG